MADKRILELSLHTSLTLSDVIPIVNNNETKKTTYGSLYYGIRDGLVSGSSQITIGDTTGFTEFSSSLSASIALGTNEQDLSNYALISGGNEFIGNQTISGSLFVSGTFTSSLEEGYTWIGGNGNRTTLVSTASFAKVGSNTFSGSQIITGSLLITGSATLNNNNIVTVSKGAFNPQFNDTSGSVVGVSQTGSYSLMDDVCFFRVNVDFANCTNFGTGQYQIQLPFPVNYKTTLRGGTLHQTSGSSGGTSYNITGLSAETGSTSTLLLYYTGTTSYLNWKFNTPVSASTTSSHFDINGTYQIA